VDPSSFPVVPTDSRQPAARGEGSLVPGKVPVHAAGEMGFDPDAKLRQECWQTLGERTRTRLNELAGGIIDWYAGEDPTSPDGRSYAVVFGDRGLGIAEPRINTEHRPVYAISAFVFTPGTLRHMQVDHQPPQHAPGPSTGSPAPGTAPGLGTAPDLGLGKTTRGLLGNLPPQAQELLQAPYTNGQPVLRHDWAYEGTEHRLNMFMLYFAGPRDVTVATGSKVIPIGHTDASAHWNLTCYRATVARRIGK
jgi:hypothetical protein